MFLLFYD